MKSKRVLASLLHSWYHMTHTMETWVDLFWNSSLQMLVFAFIATGFADPLQGTYIVVGLVFWNIIWSAQYGITVGVLWEIWSQSLSSLFISPLTLEEFLAGQAISGVVKACIAVLVTSVIGGLIYHFSLAVFGWELVIYFIELFLFGIAMGMIVLSLIFKWGIDVQSFSWSIVYLIQPFGAVFYPISTLPSQIRWVAYGIPTAYIFETIRGQLKNGRVNWEYIGIATVLNIVYLLVSYFLLKKSFFASKRSGAFARLEV
jgi:ABC-2 type transport system permease protein